MPGPVPRNAVCPCGSGQRFKDCHGRIDDPAVPAEPPARAAAAFAAIERALSAVPSQPQLWRAALDAVISGTVSDAGIGSQFSMHGAQPLRVAVVTPYFREDLAVLKRCHDSVAAQSYPCRHFMVADGYPRAELDAWPIEHLRMDWPHGDYGDTPRAVGGETAARRGFDAVAYLDADNSFRPCHVESLVCRQQTGGAPVVYAGRTLHLPDGELVPTLMVGDHGEHIDTNCLLLGREAFSMLAAWRLYPRPMSMIDDRVFRQMLAGRGFVPACTGALTVRYTVDAARFYTMLGRAAPADVRKDFDLGPLADWYQRLSGADRDALSRELGFDVPAFMREFFAPRGVAL